METKKCLSCGELVLSTEKFCKNCGKPLEQKNENDVVVENPNKKVLLTFDALDQSIKGVSGHDGKDAFGLDAKVVYSIEVDGNFIGKIESGEKIDTFVTKGKHNIILKRNKSFIPNEEEISVEDNQTILLYNLYFLYPTFLTNPSDTEKEKIWQRDKKIAKMGSRVLWIFLSVLLLLSILVRILD